MSNNKILRQQKQPANSLTVNKETVKYLSIIRQASVTGIFRYFFLQVGEKETEHVVDGIVSPILLVAIFIAVEILHNI